MLEKIGQADLAARLRRCADARRGRDSGSGWPWTCRSIGCVWCRQPLIRGWWAGMRAWCLPDDRTLALVPVLYEPGGLRMAVRRLRRALRDLRDRHARNDLRWRHVGFAGLLTGSGTAMIVVDRGPVRRAEIFDAVRHRWAEAEVTDLTSEAPSMAMTVADAVEVASVRRGAEPLRLLVLPQLDRPVRMTPAVDSMPIVW